MVRDNPFFWDTVQLASKHGHYFFETNFSSLILPENIDSGHLPAFGMYIALCWKIFGKTLMVSHFAMLPFLIGIGYFLLKIGHHIVGEKAAPLLLLLCFADPVLASQSILVSPDIVLVFFFLMGVYAVWSNHSKWLLMIAIIGLGLISMRGMMLGVGLYFFTLYLKKEKIKFQILFIEVVPFIPGGLIAGAFLLYHFYETGWIGYHPNSPWAPSYERVGAAGFTKNIAVLGWRMLDFGRVFACLGLLLFLKRFLPKNLKRFPKTMDLVALATIVFIVTVPTQLFYKALLAHRYLLPFFISLHFLLIYLLFGEEIGTFRKSKVSKFIFPAIIFGFVLGNIWVYPKKISQGWDSTLAHVHWYDIQKDVRTYLDENSITPSIVGTAFPNIGPREWYELNGEMVGYGEKDLSENCFLLYSNIMNDFSDEEIDELENQWQAVYQKEQMGVCAIIYKNPNKEICGN